MNTSLCSNEFQCMFCVSISVCEVVFVFVVVYCMFYTYVFRDAVLVNMSEML